MCVSVEASKRSAAQLLLQFAVRILFIFYSTGSRTHLGLLFLVQMHSIGCGTYATWCGNPFSEGMSAAPAAFQDIIEMHFYLTQFFQIISCCCCSLKLKLCFCFYPTAYSVALCVLQPFVVCVSQSSWMAKSSSCQRVNLCVNVALTKRKLLAPRIIEG